jgi:signal transduction histidine kinase/putative methionine-R-sulfoxide reductase with GAF domain
MPPKAKLPILPIHDHFSISQLLDKESLEPYNNPHELKPFAFRMRRTSLTVGRLDFLDPDFRLIAPVEPHLRLCGPISEALIGTNECATTCGLRKSPAATDVPIFMECGAGIKQIQSSITVEGKIAGYVRGPELPLARFYNHDLSKLSVPLREDLIEYRAKMGAINWDVVKEAVSRIARRLSRRCQLERRLKIHRHTRKRIVEATTSATVLESAFLGLQALFGEVDNCLYKLVDSGNLALVNAKGPNELFQASTLKAGEGHVGAVIGNGAQICGKDLLTDPQGFLQVNPLRLAQSAFTVPLLWGADQAKAALQVSSSVMNRFTKPDMQTIRAIVDLASLAAARAELFARRRLEEIRMVGNSAWTAAMVEAVASPADTLVQVLAAKLALCQALVEEARRVCGAHATGLRIWSETDGTLYFVACSGPVWTDELKKIIYKPGEKSAGLHAINLGAPYHVQNVASAEHYYEILPATRSLFVIPYKSRGKIAGVFSADWDYETTEPPNREDLLRLIRQFQGFLAVLDAREDSIQSRLGAALRKQRMLDERQLATIAKEAASETKIAFAARACSVFIVFPHEQKAQLIATTGLMPTEIVTYEPGEGLTGWVLANKKCLRLEDTANDDKLREVDPNLRRAERFREDVEYGDAQGKMGFLAAPMIGISGLVGVIRLTIKNDLTKFSAEEETLLLQIAREMAVTIESGWELAKANVELTATFGELRHLHDLLLAFASETDPDKLIRRVLSAAIEESKMNLGIVRLLNPAGDRLVLRAQQGPPAGVLPPELPLFDFARASLKAETPRYIPKCSKDTEWLAVLESLPQGTLRVYMESLGSLIHVPIRLGDRNLGLVLLQSVDEVRISDRVLEFLSMLGTYAAVAIQLAAARSESLDLLEKTRRLALGGAVAAGVRHQINNSLVNLTVLAKNIPAVLAERSVAMSKVMAIQNEIKVLGELTHILVLAKNPESASMARFELGQAVGDFLGGAERPLLKNIPFRFEATGPVDLHGNWDLLRVALFNVVQNAAAAISQGGEVSVHVYRNPLGHPCLEVRDSGSGMDPQTLAQCFDPFTGTSGDAGRGLGLAAVKAVVELHRAAIFIDSKPGMGTIIRIEFPLD